MGRKQIDAGMCLTSHMLLHQSSFQNSLNSSFKNRRQQIPCNISFLQMSMEMILKFIAYAAASVAAVAKVCQSVCGTKLLFCASSGINEASEQVHFPSSNLLTSSA